MPKAWAPAATVPRQPVAQQRQHSIQTQEVGDHADQVAHQPFAIPPEPVDLAPAAAPTMVLPALQADAGDPAGALADGRRQPLWEVLPGGQRLAAPETERNEDLAKSELVQPQAVLVVFGERVGVEDPASFGGQPFERRAGESGAHAVGGQESSQQLPHRDVLGLVLGKLVAVDAVGQLSPRRGQRQYRHLDHVELPGVSADQVERIGVDHVLGVVGDDHLEAAVELPFIAQHAGVDGVQAVGFGGGPRLRSQCQADIWEAGFQLSHHFQRGLVIGVDADEELVVEVVESA